LYTRETVWKDVKNSWEIIEKVCSGVRPAIPDTIPVPVKELIIDCWAADPIDRPTFKRIHEKLENFRTNKPMSPESETKSEPLASPFELKAQELFGTEVS
jgi:hypothetical protein